jgi:hypothetical protein
MGCAPAARRLDFNGMTPEWVLGVLVLLVTLITFTVNHMRDRRIQRADLIRAITSDFYQSSRVAELFMAIDHDQLEIDDTFVGSSRELTMIQFLDVMNAIGYNWKRGVLPIKDLMHTTLGYAALRAYENPSVISYLGLVDSWDTERFMPQQGFEYFRSLGQELQKRCGRTPRRDRSGSRALHGPAPADDGPATAR